MALDSSKRAAGRFGWVFVSAALLGVACGGEDNAGDDDDDADSTSGTSTATSGGTPNPANCPAANPSTGQSCNGFDPGLACSYGGSTCTCSGLTWNCANTSSSAGASTAGQNAGTPVGSTNTTSSGAPFGGSGGSSSGTDGPGITGGINTNCEGVTPVQGAACEVSGTICGLEGGEDVCVCFALESEGPIWTCANGDIGGFGGNGGD